MATRISSQMTLEQRLDHFTDKSGGSDACWLWAANKLDDKGYGRLPWKRKNLKAYRNPRCINPAHLFLGTQADNVADMVAKGRNIAPRGDKHWTHGRGTLMRGERHPNAKLTWEQARAIRAASGFHHDIAAQFGVSRATVTRIKGRAGWHEDASTERAAMSMR